MYLAVADVNAPDKYIKIRDIIANQLTLNELSKVQKRVREWNINKGQ